MNERIKELAEQAGLIADGEHWFSAIQETDVRSIDLERFAELVRQDERDKCAQDYLQDCCNAIDAARLEEREACAKLCDDKASQSGSDHEAGGMYWCAELIRARGEA